MTEQDIFPDATEECWNRIGVRGDRSCEKLVAQTHCRNCDVYGNAARHLMQRAIPEDYRRSWTEHFARAEEVRETADRSALVFRIGREWLALPAHAAITVAESSPVHRLPHRSGKILLGVVNVKGKLYPCMSLADLLEIGMEEPAPIQGRRIYPRTLVMQLGQQVYALPVQDLHGIHRYSRKDLETPPATTNKSVHRYLDGVLSVADMRIGCLDAELIGYNFASVLK